AKEIVAIACRIRPDQATLVPERRMEVTTEGGLDVKKNLARIKAACARLKKSGVVVSLFINPSKDQIDASLKSGAEIIELHTGEYANAGTDRQKQLELEKLKTAADYAVGLGLEVNAGHGLNYDNTRDVAAIKGMHELNIGHSIIARAVFTGLGQAVRDMLELVR
ncbi:MAG: pyridoxine 5'-phosphate synthase, partial [Candidatus Omnitrophica bacterium]|nr:pyridoxine 5'-phosphate synthase [Candidatus Omnitrophota bacterium]